MTRQRDWLRDSYGDVKARWWILLGLAGLAAVVVAIGFSVVATESHECALASRQLHRPASYHFLGGCYVGIGHGQKVPLENYNAFRDAK